MTRDKSTQTNLTAIKTLAATAANIWANPIGKLVIISAYSVVVAILTMAVSGIWFQLGFDTRLLAVEADGATLVTFIEEQRSTNTNFSQTLTNLQTSIDDVKAEQIRQTDRLLRALGLAE